VVTNVAPLSGQVPEAAQRQLRQSFHILGLRAAFGLERRASVSSVAATGGVMAAQAGWWTLPAIAILALPFIVSSGQARWTVWSEVFTFGPEQAVLGLKRRRSTG
jgi:hypothetical protein